MSMYSRSDRSPGSGAFHLGSIYLGSGGDDALLGGTRSTSAGAKAQILLALRFTLVRPFALSFLPHLETAAVPQRAGPS